LCLIKKQHGESFNEIGTFDLRILFHKKKRS
jgi:hypothetical protein